jgi:hypothetical protein
LEKIVTDELGSGLANLMAEKKKSIIIKNELKEIESEQSFHSELSLDSCQKGSGARRRGHFHHMSKSKTLCLDSHMDKP